MPTEVRLEPDQRKHLNIRVKPVTFEEFLLAVCRPRRVGLIILGLPVLFGTPIRSEECHPSYVGECVPIASDVDCAGGSGNGPVYIVGPVQVVGPDEYDLDRDGDGIGCD